MSALGHLGCGPDACDGVTEFGDLTYHAKCGSKNIRETRHLLYASSVIEVSILREFGFHQDSDLRHIIAKVMA